MARRATEDEVKAAMVRKIVEVLYPLLIPVEQQDCAIQARNYEHMTKVAEAAWQTFTEARIR